MSRKVQVEIIENKNKQNYDHYPDNVDAAVDELQQQNNEGNAQPVAPNTQHINDQDLVSKTKPSELFGCFDTGSSKEYSQCDMLMILEFYQGQMTEVL